MKTYLRNHNWIRKIVSLKEKWECKFWGKQKQSRDYIWKDTFFNIDSLPKWQNVQNPLSGTIIRGFTHWNCAFTAHKNTLLIIAIF